ncbi:sigma-54-dependent Fis family transcriptional regulator [bacterium]|nr:sigma-54-dependent Fis family transcriptional regulator [bacterium]
MASERLLIVDDDREFCEDLAIALGGRYEVRTAHGADEARGVVAAFVPQVVLLDVDLDGDDKRGILLLEQLLAAADPPAVIMLSGDAKISTVVAAMQLGAFHYVGKPAELPDLVNLIDRALASGRSARHIEAQRGELGRLTGSLICADETMQTVLHQADTVAVTEATVLLTGESGTGKEMFARHIHDHSPRREGPFVGINCAAIPRDLIESEVFGTSPTAYTGAESRMGKLELASGGTFFLDEVGEATLDLQVKLLRALGERVFVRLGENRERAVDCRLIAATSRNLEKAIAAGTFREDLYYRLNIYRIELPPLRRRPGDVMALADHFLAELAGRNNRRISGFSGAVLERIRHEPWQGNVRELRNFVERAVINCRGPVITLADMFGAEAGPDPDAACGLETGSLTEAGDEAKRRRERVYCINRLVEAGGNVTRAAELSGVHRSAFQRKLRDLDIDPGAYRTE